MSELVSAYPTSGGIYWWASKLGGVRAGYYTGWLNLIGLLAIVASVAYGCAHFFDLAFGFFVESWAEGYSLQRVFWMFLVVLAIIASVLTSSAATCWRSSTTSPCGGTWSAPAIVVLILIFVPDNHQSVSLRLHGARQQHRWPFRRRDERRRPSGSTSCRSDSCSPSTRSPATTRRAHLCEETHSAADAAAKGIWRSIFYSAIGGYILLLAFVFAVQDPKDGVAAGGGGVRHLRPGARLEMGRARAAHRGLAVSSTAPLLALRRRRACCSRSAVTERCRARGTGPSCNAKRVPVNGVILLPTVVARSSPCLR